MFIFLEDHQLQTQLEPNILRSDRYSARPAALENLCLAEFSANYTIGVSDNIDEEPDDGDDDHTSETIILQNGMGKMHRRRKEAIIRFHRPSLENEPEKYYRTMLMLYLPWRDEEIDLKGNHETFQEQWQAMRELIVQNEIYRYNHKSIN